MKLALGLMSGTSADGVSVAAVSFKERSFRILAHRTFPYPKKIREKILGAFRLKTPEISSLNFELGTIFAAAALKIMKRARLKPRDVRVIGSHGQTIYHGPRDRVPSTFQIGEAAILAEATGIPVVSDFRPPDIALGGEGAPLVPYFDFYFYGRGPVRAFQNIGGISNVTVVGRGLKSPVAFDTGPGNCLMDLAIRKITKGRLACDRSGKWAAQGEVDHKKIAAMMRHPYFKKRPPKSTGWEKFGGEFLELRAAARNWRRPFDLLATLNYFTALTIFEGLQRFAPKSLKEVIVSGGGAKNLTLMKNLKELFKQNRGQVTVRSIEALGIPAQAKEPVAFAFLALRALERKANHLPETTGACRAATLGKLCTP